MSRTTHGPWVHASQLLNLTYDCEKMDESRLLSLLYQFTLNASRNPTLLENEPLDIILFLSIVSALTLAHTINPTLPALVTSVSSHVVHQ